MMTEDIEYSGQLNEIRGFIDAVIEKNSEDILAGTPAKQVHAELAAELTEYPTYVIINMLAGMLAIASIDKAAELGAG